MRMREMLNAILMANPSVHLLVLAQVEYKLQREPVNALIKPYECMEILKHKSDDLKGVFATSSCNESIKVSALVIRTSIEI